MIARSLKNWRALCQVGLRQQVRILPDQIVVMVVSKSGLELINGKQVEFTAKVFADEGSG